GVYDCIDASSSGNDHADNSEDQDSASLPSCSGGGQRDTASDDVAALGETTYALDEVTAPTGASPALNLTKQKQTLRLSILSAADQATMREAIRTRYGTFVNQTVEGAYQTGQATDMNGMLRGVCDQMKTGLLAKMDEALAGDFLVRVA
ncbi:MAG: hypothetical protein QOG31_1290, partial [Thermoplasmata archaeon]|nr:hypothetical protein [Thermoplasmata archaeon]